MLLLYNPTIYIGPPVTYYTPGKIPKPKNILVFYIGLYVDIVGVDIDSSLEDKKVFTYFDFFSYVYFHE